MLKLNTFSLRRRIITLLGVRRPFSNRAKLIVALLIFFVSFITNSLQSADLAAVIYTDSQPFGVITSGFDQQAMSILNGEGLLGPYALDPSQTAALARPPGYPILLAAIYATLGRDFFTVQTAQNLLNSISPVLIFLIAGLIISWHVGAVSGMIAALSHHLSHISNFLLPDSLAALPILAAVCLIVFAFRARKQDYWLYAIAGCLLGLSVWLRPQAMLLAPLLVLIITGITKQQRFVIKRALVMALASFIVIAPITIRNYLVYGEFVPVSIGIGLNLWEGLAEASGDRFGAVKMDQEVAEQEAALYDNPAYANAWHSPDGVLRDRDRTKKSLKIIFENPVWYAGVMIDRMRDMTKYSAYAPLVFKSDQVKTERSLTVKKEWRTIAPAEPSLGIGKYFAWLRAPVRYVQRLIKEPMQFFILLGLVIVAVISPRRTMLLLMVPIYYLLFQSFLHTEFRYTLPMQYFLFTFAAVFWYLLGAALWRWIRSQKSRVKSSG